MVWPFLNQQMKRSMSKDREKESNIKGEAEAAAEPPAPEEASEMEASPETAREDVSSLLKKLDEATAEVVSQKERYLRTVADLENYRRRALRDKEEARRQANCGLVEDLLPVLDNFKLGLQSAETHEGGDVFAQGFRMILSQMEGALKQNGLEEINPGTEAFDPNYHEAVAHLPHEEVEEGSIIEVQRIGYKLHDRLLRPAVVVISNGPPGEASEESETE